MESNPREKISDIPEVFDDHRIPVIDYEKNYHQYIFRKKYTHNTFLEKEINSNNFLEKYYR